MKKTIRKVFLSILAAATIMTASTSVSANKITVNMPSIIHEAKNTEILGPGVSHEHIRKFTTLGWWNINVIRVDMKNEYAELKGIFNPEGINKRDSVSKMVDKNKAIAGVNGDYFNYSPMPSAMGTLINDGEVISSPVERAYALPTFYLTNSNTGDVGYLDRNIIATNKTSGKTAIVNTLNKVTPSFDTLTLLNKHWGSHSVGNKFHKDLVEVVVSNGVVQDVRVGKAPVPIPKDNGYVIAGRGQSAQIIRSYKIGDTVDLQVGTVPNADAIKFAIGGGSIILKNGELSLTNINSAGLHPRTGIGVNKDNTEIILVTIDGRHSSFKGVSQEAFGAILRDLGAYHGLNLDGGGSTTMATKSIGDEKSKVVNRPSDGGERLVVNGVGVFTKDAPVGELSYLKVSSSEPTMFVNTTRNIEVKGFDKNHNPVEIDRSLVNFKVENVEANFEGNKFKPTTSGKATISANYNGNENIKGQAELRVLGEIKDITTDTDSINVSPNSQHRLPTFYGQDGHGISARIYLEDIDFQVVGDIGKVENGVFYSNENQNGGAIIARAGDGLENILVSASSTGTIIDNFENIENYSFNSHPQTVNGSISISKEAKEGENSLSLKYNFSQGEGTRAAYILLNPKNSGLKLEQKPNRLGLWVKGDGNGSWLRGSLKDSTGKEHTIDFSQTVDWSDWRYVEAKISNDIPHPITLEKIYLVETDDLRKQSGEILVDGLNAYYPKAVEGLELPEPTKFIDSLNKKDNVLEDGFSFIVGYEPQNIYNIGGNTASQTMTSRLNKHKLSVSLNPISSKLRGGLKNYYHINPSSGYKLNKHYDVLFVSLNASKGGIRVTNADQWIALKNDLSNREEKNFTITLANPIFGNNGFTDKLEADLFHDTLKAAQEKGKNIFVIHGGATNSNDLRDGIRYIGLDTRNINSKDQLKNISAVEFVVNKDSISYEVSKLFQ